jgi:hypothetical protein
MGNNLETILIENYFHLKEASTNPKQVSPWAPPYQVL